LSDPIADMLTRVRNAVRINKEQITVRASNICEGIADVLKKEGYIKDFDRIDDGKQGILRITLKYDQQGQPVINDITRKSKPSRRIYSSVDGLPRVLAGMGISIINEIARVSKPSRRVYSSVDQLPHVLGGYGVAIISTSKGVMSDRDCRQANVGGEILCTVS
jgi:small subunit ribosomal protein S8